jgi:mono/diheme cytochrome c family protein
MPYRLPLNFLSLGISLLVFLATVAAPSAPLRAQDVDGGEGSVPEAESAPAVDPMLERGYYLARMGNCISCHTHGDSPEFGGGVPFHISGGPFSEPVGTIYSTNISPDTETGIGNWTEEEFSRAMRAGVSASGSHLYPAFPYTAFSKVTEDDMSAIYAYIMSLEPVKYTPPENDVPFPLNMRVGLFFWNLLFAENEVFQPDPTQSEEWNRGAYLTEGLGHCGACHTPRNFFLAEDSDAALSGGTYFNLVEEGKVRKWSAVNLTSASTGLGPWPERDVANYLRTGHSFKAGSYGPMNEVIENSMQYLTEEDAKAMAVYIKSLPPIERDTEQTISEEEQALGLAVYEEHCEECHLQSGRGAFLKSPPVSGSAVVQAPNAASLINITLYGADPPSGVPLPFGAWEDMAAFGGKLTDEEIAALSNYLRTAWDNKGSRVTAEDVGKQR